jgi:signal transduction histidine kinase
MALPDEVGSGLSLAALVDLVFERAETPGEARDHLAKLLEATRAINSELNLQSTLRNVVQVARELVSAKFGAIGVISPEGTLEAFIHVGLADDVVARLGPPPTGRGILGAVIAEKQPIRLADLAEDHRSVGFPEGHPPMADFLGVPVRVGGTIYGNLYLTGSAHGEFDDLDEKIMLTLAGMAGTVIANARLYEEARMRNRWLAASEETNHGLLSSNFAESNLRDIAEKILDLADAGFVGIQHAQDAAEPRATQHQATLVRLGPLSEDPTFEPDLNAPTTLVLPWVEISPVTTGSGARIELIIARAPGAHPFSIAESKMAERFTSSVALARELSSARNDRERVALADERDRIARDLHDHVIQSLFAIGLGMQSVVGSSNGLVAARLSSHVDAIDVTIRQIRQTIFQLSSPPSAATYSLKSRLNSLVRETLDGEGIDSSLDFTGPIDTLVEQELSDEITAVLREALSNVVRHANASRVDISVSVGADVRIVVTDNGRGLSEGTHRSGLHNLEERARLRGGTFAVVGRAPSGTSLDWTVPAKGR